MGGFQRAVSRCCPPRGIPRCTPGPSWRPGAHARDPTGHCRLRLRRRLTSSARGARRAPAAGRGRVPPRARGGERGCAGAGLSGSRAATAGTCGQPRLRRRLKTDIKAAGGEAGGGQRRAGGAAPPDAGRSAPPPHTHCLQQHLLRRGLAGRRAEEAEGGGGGGGWRRPPRAPPPLRL